MAQRVQVIVEAKDSASGVLRGITSQFGALGSSIEELTGKNVNWGNLATQATTLVVDGLKASITATQEYAASVRDLSLASGATAEESSRLLQVLDDFEISAGDVTTATRALTKEGLAPTVQTIAELSDKYLALNTAQEKNKFIQENLGRGGSQWANVLKEGSKAILELNAGVSENLILTEQDIIATENYRLALDNWNDAIQGAKVSLGMELLPILTDVLNAVEAGTSATEGNIKAWEYLFPPIAAVHSMYLLLTDGITNYNALQTASATITTAAGEAAAAAAPNYENLLSMTEKLNGATREQIKLAAYQDLKKKMAESGGETTAEEAAALDELGIALGIFDTNALAASKAVSALNAQMLAGTITAKSYAAALNAIPTSVETSLTQTITTNAGDSLGGGRASGGSVYAGQPYTVGENGAENFVPSQNGRILSQSESLHAAGMSSGGANYFYGNVTLSVDEDTTSGLLGYR